MEKSFVIKRDICQTKNLFELDIYEMTFAVRVDNVSLCRAEAKI